MALKRKRSSPALSSPTSDNCSDASISSSSPLSSFYPFSKPAGPIFQKVSWPSPTYDDAPSDLHLGSRTRKRHRDDRPDEEAVHANTISMLYQAQRQYPHASPVNSAPEAAPAQQPAQQQSTLHVFWRISQPPKTSELSTHIGLSANAVPTPKCEGCDGPLRNEDAMDIDDVSISEQDAECNACRRQVCSSCSINHYGRFCLACASMGYR